MIFSYSLSLPFDSLHLRNMTEASTLAGENVFGSLRSEITLRRIVLRTMIGYDYNIMPFHHLKTSRTYWSIFRKNFSNFRFAERKKYLMTCTLNNIMISHPRIQISINYFLRYNDLSENESLQPCAN